VHFVLPFIAFVAGMSHAAQSVAPAKRWSHLHPAFRIDDSIALRIFEKAFKDAEKAKDTKPVWRKIERGIGSIRLNALGRSQTVSWLYAVVPRLVIYEDGFKSRKQYRDPQEIEKSRELHKWLWKEIDFVRFAGTLGIYPSFGGAYGRISRHADPADLRDVRVVLKVGERIYQPRTQPGTLSAESGQSVNVVSVPQVSTTTVTGSASGSSGTVYGNATAYNYYTTHFTQGYNWYKGSFAVDFDLFEPDGSARITTADKEITVIVIYGPNERKATYMLEDLASIGN